MNPSPRARIAIGIAAMVGIAGVGMLGLAWQIDRSRAWERPRWQPREFVALGAGSALEGRRRPPPSVAGELWLVSVHPGCGHCLRELERYAREPHPGAELGALIVDAPRRPATAFLRSLPVERVWWDRNGIWRRRWGHRLYGELLRFDSHGRYLAAPAGEARGEGTDMAAERR